MERKVAVVLLVALLALSGVSSVAAQCPARSLSNCYLCQYCSDTSACTDGRCPGAGSMCNMCGCTYLCDSCGFCGRKLLMGS
ncbi:hypothetical protein WJX81_002437 [Elliptochloris bilobata]|uniref:Uncharacterized protein n=1 Tax=Elliptochloris bilobata TaxID=381761 RepID=A0AAW1QYZ0_9CHLO